MPNCLLGLDMGTGGCKAALIDREGQVLAYAFREYPFINERPGWSGTIPIFIKLVCELFKQAIEQAHAEPAKFCVGEPGTPAPGWLIAGHHFSVPISADRRACSPLGHGALGEERAQAQWIPAGGSPGPGEPDVGAQQPARTQIDQALTIGGYIVLRHWRAVVNCSRHPAYNLRNNEFSAEILDEIGLDRRLLPEVHSCEEIVGEVTATAAADCGLAAGTPVAAGQADACAGWIGAGAVELGDFQSNLGTVGNFGIIHQDYDFVASPSGYLMGITLPYTLKDTLVTIPSTLTGGQSIRYLRDAISQQEVETERILGISSYDLLNLQAARVPVGSDGLIVLPFLMGERSPLWDVNARGVVFGLSLNHTKGHLVRAMMEGVAYAMYDSFRRIKDCGLKINYPLVLNEGGAVSQLWRQIITDVFNIPTALVKRRTGAPYGDGILAGVATGVFPDFSVARQWAEYIEQLDPNPENHARYMEYFSVYKQLYEHVKVDYKALATVRDR
jgi:xylulokinase